MGHPTAADLLIANVPFGAILTTLAASGVGFLVGYRSLMRRRIRGARYDTGKDSLTTFYLLMRGRMALFVRRGIIEAGVIAIAASIVRVIMLHPQTPPPVAVITLVVMVAVSVATGYQLGRVLVFAAAWLKLERRGLLYETRNGQAYRVRFIHKTGASDVDDTTWQARLRSEHQMVTTNDEQIARCWKKSLLPLLTLVGSGIALYVLLSLATTSANHDMRDIGIYGLYYKIPSLACGLAASRVVAAPAAELFVVLMDRFVYNRGAQFVPFAHVEEAASSRVYIEDVRAQKNTGAAKFHNPFGRS